MKVKVKRVVTVEYEYPYNTEYCGDDTQDDVVEFEKNSHSAIVEAITYGDYTEDVTVDFVEET